MSELDLRRDPCPTCKHDPLGMEISSFASCAELENRDDAPTARIRWPVEGLSFRDCPQVEIPVPSGPKPWAERLRRAARDYYRSRRAEFFALVESERLKRKAAQSSDSSSSGRT